MPYADVDQIAYKLAWLGDYARNMSPSWDGDRISVPVRGPHGGEWVVQMLPCKGLYVDMYLKDVGITKSIPNVYERSVTQRLIDFFRYKAPMLFAGTKYYKNGRIIDPERGAITTYDGIISAR